jgi:hypothetical protein
VRSRLGLGQQRRKSTADIAADGETAVSTQEMTARIVRALKEGTLSP